MSAASSKVLATTLLNKMESGSNMDQLARSLAAYLIEEKQVGNLNSIVREMKRLLLQGRDISYVKVTSANKLDQSQIDEIKNMFKAQDNSTNVIIEETIDKDVIGGVRCETADQVLDLTVRRQLQRLKNSV